MVRIKVDFNNLVRGGQIGASRRNADGDLRKGDVVEAFDPDEDLAYEATVVELDTETGRVYLQPHWEPSGAVTVPASDWTFQWTVSNDPAGGRNETTHIYGKPQHVILLAPARPE